MFKEIWSALRGTDKLTSLIAKLGEMLEIGKWMFERASEALMKETDWTGISDSLYERDRKINELERDVREGILTHLAVGRHQDIAASLVLMSVVKDAERIGDYCKNIFEVGKFYRREYTHPEYAQPLSEIRQTLEELFDNAKGAFTECDPIRARSVLDVAGGLTKKCDLLIQQLLSVHEQLAADEAVAYVLLSRFYKRVSAHLANIATSVVSPVPMLDYHGNITPEIKDPPQ
jgi:phosphate uptake regulator